MRELEVSIIVPSFNPKMEFFLPCIDSLLSQPGVSFEIIIVDDGSSSGIDLYDKYLKLQEIKIIFLGRNFGGGVARNVGIANAEGSYIAFCDSDDIWPTEKLAYQLSQMKKNRWIMSHGDMLTSNNRLLASNEIIDLAAFLEHTDIYCSTVVILRDIALYSSFSELRKRHPFKMWVGLFENGVVSHRSDFLPVTYTVRDDSVSAKSIATFFYTVLAYLIYPKEKLKALRCLFLRINNGFKYNSRIWRD
jgi:teichuronic acid biosynthesis glycosyltransferase TuaG